MPNPVPELAEVALDRAPRSMLHLPEDGIVLPTWDRATGLVTSLGGA